MVKAIYSVFVETCRAQRPTVIVAQILRRAPAPTSRLEELEQVLVDHIRVRRRHAMRASQVDDIVNLFPLQCENESLALVAAAQMVA